MTGFDLLYRLNHARCWRGATRVWQLRVRVESFDRRLYCVLHRIGLMGRDERRWYERLLRPGLRVADVGANVGLYAMLMGRLVGPEGKVHAFEPDPLLFRTLEANCRENGLTNVRTWNLALSDGAGTAFLSRSPIHSGDNRLRGSASAAAAALAVRTGRLDQVLAEDPPDFVKTDTQGHDGHVIWGMERWLQGDRALAVMFEYWPEGLRQAGSDPDELLAHLRRHGFTILEFREAGRVAEVRSAAEVAGLRRPVARHFLSLLAVRGAWEERLRPFRGGP